MNVSLYIKILNFIIREMFIMNSSAFDSAKTASPRNLPELKNRLRSLDILRGFDMFWIVGGAALVRSVVRYLDYPSLMPIIDHLRHAEWEGFLAWDLIFPLFIFISGTTMPFSFEKYLASGNKGKLYLRVIRRAILLILLGFLYNGLLRTLDFANFRYLSVLGLIGLAYLWASMVVIHFKPLGQAIGAAVILVMYWGLMSFVPVPGHGAGVLTPEGNFASMIDRLIVPGTLLDGVTDPSGFLMSVPASVLAIAGALSGHLLKRQDVGQYRKCLLIGVAGVGCLLAGLGWGVSFPIIKRLWTSTFVLYALGWSLLLLALFYMVVDIWKIRRIFFPFLLIGVNPLTIYIINRRVIDFRHMADFFFGGLARLAGEPLQPVVLSAGTMVCIFVFLYILYRKKMFLKV